MLHLTTTVAEEASAESFDTPLSSSLCKPGAIIVLFSVPFLAHFITSTSSSQIPLHKFIFFVYNDLASRSITT